MAKSPKKITLAELQDYKGNVVARWRAPRTKRQSVWALIRLLRFFYRARERKFLTRELLEALKEYGRLLEDKYLAYLLAYPELIQGFRELMNYEIDRDLIEEIVEEKVREERRATCSMCGVKLVKPAYLVKRRGTEVVSVSAPIGIRCLNSFYGKLEDLIVRMKIGFESQDEPGQPRPRRNRSRHTVVHKAKQLTLF